MPNSKMHLAVALGLSLVPFLSGCGSPEDDTPERRPRPVVTEIIKRQTPPDAALVTASVGSWKTEEIGFEVQGRVEFVVEENTPIEGRIFDADDQPVSSGTPIARLESERFALQVARAKSEVASTQQNLRA
ncbi:MAG: hemolysin D, partial [Planctomycetota bacterium]